MEREIIMDNTECRFVPGETYKSRGGLDYRFIGVDTGCNRTVFYSKNYNAYTSRTLDGKYHGDSDNDILPPKRTLVQWAMVYKTTGNEPVISVYPTELSCREGFDFLNPNPRFTIIKQPFKLEVDLDD